MAETRHREARDFHRRNARRWRGRRNRRSSSDDEVKREPDVRTLYDWIKPRQQARRFKSIEWVDDTAFMLRTPEAEEVAWAMRAKDQMRRRCWPSTQERCGVCNDMFFPLVQHMRKEAERMTSYFSSSPQSRTKIWQQNVSRASMRCELWTAIHQLSDAARDGCHTCRLMIEALVNSQRGEPLAWHEWNRRTCIQEVKREEFNEELLNPTTNCQLYFCEGWYFTINVVGRKPDGSPIYTDALDTHLHTGGGKHKRISSV